MTANKVQLKLDFGNPKVPKNRAKAHTVKCLECDLPIDLTLQSVREVKACPHCGDRDWLLNLKAKDACILYGIKPKSLGGRLRDPE